MKILRLKVEGFRSLRSLSWQPGDLNVIIGPNASGKSNVLRLLEMLSVSARRGLGKYIQQEGGMEPIVWDGQAQQVQSLVEFRVGPIFEEEDSEPTTVRVLYHLILGRLGTTSAYRVDQEILELIEEPLSLFSPTPIRVVQPEAWSCADSPAGRGDS